MGTVKLVARPSSYTDGGPKVEDVHSTNNALHVSDQAVHPGEVSSVGTEGRTWGGNKADSAASATATGTIKTGAGFYYGYIVTTALSAAAITVYDNTSAAGTVIDTIVASTAAGTRGVLPTPVPVANGIHAVYAGSGTVLWLYT